MEIAHDKSLILAEQLKLSNCVAIAKTNLTIHHRLKETSNSLKYFCQMVKAS